MRDERALVARLEAADTEELAKIFLDPKLCEERVLRTHLGNERFRNLRNLALRRELRRNARDGQSQGNVVVIPGLLGSQLSSRDADGLSEQIWLDPMSISKGWLARLRLSSNGLTEYDTRYRIEAIGVMKRYYGQLILSLAECWNVHAFAYDWRKDFRRSASQLQASMNHWFPEDEPVHIVAHGAGGLVARAFIAEYPKRWKSGSRLILLGCPNHGMPITAQALTGHLPLVRRLDQLDATHDRSVFRNVIKSFPSIYQLLPSPFVDGGEEFEPLYDPDTYGAQLRVSPELLGNARQFHSELKDAADVSEQVAHVAGEGHLTVVFKDINKIKSYTLDASPTDELSYLSEAYKFTKHGDGNVPHHLEFIQSETKRASFSLEAHGSELATHRQVLVAIEELLLAVTDELHSPNFSKRITRLSGLKPMPAELPKDERQRLSAYAGAASVFTEGMFHGEASELESLIRRVNLRSNGDEQDSIGDEEREIHEGLTRGFMSASANENSRLLDRLPPPKIRISLVLGDITQEDLAKDQSLNLTYADSIGVGHYSGNKPRGILSELDRNLSQHMNQNQNVDLSDESNLLLTQFAQRGTLRGNLGEPFLIPDPRKPDRIIAVAGMGEPGRFGVPELTLLTRELCWTLGRMSKEHLATVLIGAGRKNLRVADAVCGWVHGIKLAITGSHSEHQPNRCLREVTFFLRDPQKLLEANDAILVEQSTLRKQNRMVIQYEALDEDAINAYREQAIVYASQQLEARMKKANVEPSDQAPTRITVGVQGSTYTFGAITDHASIPEREIPLDPELVKKANDELAAASTPERQLTQGQFMERLLIPEDLRSELAGSAPLVLMLDRSTARIHWELLAHSELTAAQSTGFANSQLGEENGKHLDVARFQFLGTSRGVTRQLRTIHAPPPEPPPPSHRLLRVLVVADPAEDAHLRGAEEEGIEVGDLFDRFNVLHDDCRNRVEVVRLYGPREATRTTVLRHLMMRTYDVLHFAGHCVYDVKEPSASGWIFSNGERLSANEITRIDRSPSLVFSNACESGITSARSEERNVELAPSFAEAFFERGVTNFICTAWPIDDEAARVFALTVYANLLGLKQLNSDRPLSGMSEFTQAKPASMYEAMQKARLKIANLNGDVRTWGAYQHYGNPYFRLFDPATMCCVHSGCDKLTKHLQPVGHQAQDFQDADPGDDDEDNVTRRPPR